MRKACLAQLILSASISTAIPGNIFSIADIDTDMSLLPHGCTDGRLADGRNGLHLQSRVMVSLRIANDTRCPTDQTGTVTADLSDLIFVTVPNQCTIHRFQLVILGKGHHFPPSCHTHTARPIYFWQTPPILLLS